MNEKKTVLIISPFASPNLGGVESHLDKLLSYVSKKGYYPVLLTYQPLTHNLKGRPFEKTDLMEIHRINWIGFDLFNKLENYFPLQFLYLFPGLFFLTVKYLLFSRRSISCVHAHGLAAATIARIVKVFSGVRIVVSTHAVYSFSRRRILAQCVKWVLKGFDVILAVSEVSRSEIISLGFEPSKVKVHPNWIDTDRFRIIDNIKAETSNYIKYEVNLLFVGRLIEKKGIYLFLDTAKEFPEIGFHVVGGGAGEDALRKKYSEFPNITFHGVLSQNNDAEFNKLVRLYNICDFLVSPYLYDEGFSTTLIESLACGTPVIVTDRGSPPTFLNNMVAVYLPHDPKAADLAGAIKSVKFDDMYRNNMRIACRSYAEEKFGFSNADVIINSYEQP